MVKPFLKVNTIKQKIWYNAYMRKNKGNNKGQKYGLRRQEESHPNQWTATPKQEMFLLLYLTPGSETFGNAYKSALEVGYSESYARSISGVSPQWIKEATNITKLQPEHIVQALQKESIDPLNKSSERIQALSVLARIQGLFVDKKIVAHTTIEDAINNLEE